MRRALREYQVRGIKTNISFHQWILRHPRFMAGKFDTGFICEAYHSSVPAQRVSPASPSDRRHSSRARANSRAPCKGCRRAVEMARTGKAKLSASRPDISRPRLETLLRIHFYGLRCETWRTDLHCGD